MVFDSITNVTTVNSELCSDLQGTDQNHKISCIVLSKHSEYIYFWLPARYLTFFKHIEVVLGNECVQYW